MQYQASQRNQPASWYQFRRR